MNYCIANTESNIAIEIDIDDKKHISEAINYIRKYFPLLKLIDENDNFTDWGCIKITSAKKWGYNIVYLN